jgi:hypothetical protein
VSDSCSEEFYFCFFTKLAGLMNKIKDWMTRNQDDVSEWSDICVLVLFQRINAIKLNTIDRFLQVAVQLDPSYTLPE